MPREYKLKLVLGGSQNSGKTTFINSNRNNNSPIGVSFESVECFVNEVFSLYFVEVLVRDYYVLIYLIYNPF